VKTLLFRDGLRYGQSARRVLLATVSVVGWLHPAALMAAPTITYVQGNYTAPQTPQTSAKVTFTAAQLAGDLNVVVVGWNDSTATVSTVADSSGNAYTRTVGPTVQSGVASQSIYYAKNIAAATAGANVVTVTFSVAAAYPDIRILEYSGADPNNPVDVTAASSGSSAASSSGSATTTNATDLIFGANLVQTTTSGPGSGFSSRMLTSPDGDIAEDQMVTAAGSYSATAPVSPSGQWIMQMAAFRTPSGVTTPPTVSSVSPNSGSTAGGTAVTITGTNFAAGATVTFGGTAATNVVVVNGTSITATTPARSAGAATVTVTVSGQSGSLPSGFTYIVIPTVSSVSPNSGSTAGGTAVTITGANFAAGATVTFGATAATNVVVVNNTSITATSPANAAGTVTVAVTVNGQSGSLTSGFSYILPPTVSSVSPNSGSTAGGTAVTITGTNFAGGAAVTFGGAAATNVVMVNSTTITAATPAGSAGAATVTVTVSGQSGSLTSGFTYVVIPAVSSVSPNDGSTAGGTAVTITGTNFGAGATVTFGGTAATNVVVVNSTSITATSPAHPTGAVTVTVTVSGQSGSVTNGFSYILPPTVSSVSPNSGSTTGGTAVTITGTNFAAGATLTFGGTAATNVVVVSSTTITATTPSGSAGVVTVAVTVSGQTGTLTSGFTYVVIPTVSSVSPNSGSTAGGTAVTITGGSFAPGAAVTFGGVAATNVVVISGTQITVTTPAGSAGAVTVTVTLNGQSGNLANGFSYTLPPTVSGVSPNSGSTAGGTAVTITGTNFVAGGTLTFGGTAATNVVVVNSTTITATTPAGSVGAATVTVTVSGQSGTLTSGFTYVVASTVSFVQGNYAAPQSPQTSVNVTFTAAQAAGHLNVVVVGWNDSAATVSTLTDKSGNVYTRAVGPTVQSGVASQSIYYAKNIAAAAAGANAVTVTFSIAAVYPDIRILEYSGADPNNPVDVTAASSGSSVTSSSGAVTTTNVTDLLFGANLVQTTTSGPGSGFTSRLLTSPNGDIAEDQMVTATGSYSATASLSPSGQWIMQMVAFRTPSGVTTSPTVTSVSPNGGPTAGGTAVTITGTNFAAGATVTFGGAAATNVVVGSATQITAATPPGTAGAVSVTVTLNGKSGSLANGFSYNLPPTVSSVSPNNGSTAGGTAVTVTGTNFAMGATVTFGGAAATNVVVVSGTQITATSPLGSVGAVTVTVTNPGVQSGSLANGYTYVVPAPTAPSGLTVAEGGPGPTYVNGQGYYNSTSLTTHTTTSFNSTGGDLILLLASSHQGVAFTPSDSFGNTWIAIAGPTSTAVGYDLRSQVWYAPNPIVGPGQTITMNLSLAQPLVMSIVVVKGSNTSSPIDAISLVGSDNGTSTINVTSPSIITSIANDLLVGFVKTNGTETFTAGSGFTLQSASTVLNLTAETEVAATPATYDATFTLSAGVTWQSVVGAVTNNPNQTMLSWTASTETGGTISKYLVERCQGAGCANFAQIGTATPTVLNDTGLTSSTSYSYRVRAEDTANTLGPYSSVVTITTPAPIPALPGNFTATVASGTQINLSWAASTETGGAVSNYLVERCQGVGCGNFTQITSSATTTYNDTGLAAGTSYSYRVQARDTAGNPSPFSNVASATTQGPPTAPGNLTATAASASQINLSWTASTSSIGLANYIVQRCQGAGCTNFAQVASFAATTVVYNDAGLTVGTSYSYRVQASDTAGNLSPFSNVASASTLSSGTTITYVQGAYTTPQSAQTSVSVTFTAAQTAGGLNVVVVGWNNSTSTVSTVIDKSGNTYTLAVGPTVQSGTASQSIYYAKNIAAAAAGANSVTVTFSAAAAYPDIRILEYSGADPNNPVDVTAASSGSSATSSSGSVTTTNAPDLLFGANLVQTITTGPGSGFTERLLTSQDGDIAEDQMVTATGSYSAAAPLSSGQWIMQMVAFRTSPGSGPAPSVNVSSTNLNFGNVQTGATSSPQPVTVTNVGTAQLTISAIAVSGGNVGDFAQTNTCGATLAPNATCAINVTFTPTNTGTRSSSVLITDNAPGSPQSVNLSGTGTGFTVTPGVSVLTFAGTQQFTASSGSVTWSVDGVAGGSASSGTITTGGLYTPPASTGTHTVTATTSLSQSASATVYITNYPGTFTYHNDNLRTGQNLNETVLTLSNVNQSQFGKLLSYSIDGMAFASPLYVANVSIPGRGYHNVVYVATANDSVYAFDADGLSTTSLWHVSFLKSGVTTVPCADTGECGDILTQIGITSTPVIDQTSGTLYVVAATKEGASTWVQRLHALDITTGAEKFGGPVVLQASVPGTGSGSSGGNVAFDPLRENQRPGLLLSGGVVYLAFGSHGDNSPWHGWVLGYNATTLQQTMYYNVTPNGNGGGIWQGGGGLATDATGDIYYVTSNGDFDANTGGVDYGDSVQKLSSSGVVMDYFTPHDQQNMDVNNLDLGAGGPVLLVDQTTGSFPHLLITAGKNGTIYVVNRDNLGKYNANNDNQIVQSLPGVLPNGSAESGNFSTPVYFNGYVYFGAVNDTLKAFQLTNGQLSTAPTSQSATIYGIRGASFAISANSASNGIIWALQNNGASADNDVGNPGVLFAYNASDLSTELYNSSQAGSRDTLDNAVKFSIPLVANGKVFVAGQTQLTVFGLLP